MIRIDTAGVNEVVHSLKGLSSSLATSRLMYQLGQFAMVRIKARTMEGKDAQGRSFIPYSDDYKFFRAEAGHSTSKPNLFFRGHMLAAMDVKTVGDDTAIIYFVDTEQAAKAHGHNFGCSKTGLPQREFFALSAEDIKDMQAMIDDHISTETAKNGL